MQQRRQVGEKWLLGFCLGFVLAVNHIILGSASIHEYRNDAFTNLSNAFFFHGGGEGIYASQRKSSGKTNKGKSFIRYFFCLIDFVVHLFDLQGSIHWVGLGGAWHNSSLITEIYVSNRWELSSKVRIFPLFLAWVLLINCVARRFNRKGSK